METAVIVLNYNGKTCLNDCLRSLLKSRYKDFEVILVDNASTDGSLEDAEKKFKKEIESKKIRVIRSLVNTGFAEGNNIGYRRMGRGVKYAALLNNDSVVPPDWLGKVTLALKNNPDASIVGSLVIDDGLHLTPREFDEACRSTMTLNMEQGSMGQGRRTRDGSYENFVVSGNGMVVRRSDFKRLFNPDYFAYAEDTDICWNARLRKKKVLTRLDVEIQHRGSVAKRSSKAINKIAVFNGTKNQIINFLVHYEMKNIVRVLPLFVLTQLLQTLHSPRKFIVKLKAYFWTVICFGRILRYRKEIQKTRKVADREIIKDLSGIMHNELVAKGAVRRLLRVANKAALLYCRIVRLGVVETQQKK